MFQNLKCHTKKTFGSLLQYTHAESTGTHEPVHPDGHLTDDAQYVS